MAHALVPTTLVGSYPPPTWLVDTDLLGELLPQRVPNPALWRVGADHLGEALDDATLAVVADQLAAGVDIVTDGEVRRASYSERFSNALDGIDRDHPGTATSRTGAQVAVPRIVGPIERREAVEVDVARLIGSVFQAPLKVTLPGPFTMAQLCQDDYYSNAGERAMAFAGAVNAEMHELFAAGVAVVQIDEPYLQARADEARDYALDAIAAALAGAKGRTTLHSCFGYGRYVKDKPAGYPFFAELAGCAADDISIESAQPDLDLAMLTELGDKTIQLGVIDCASHDIETPDAVADRIGRAAETVAVGRLVAAPDCGMKYLPRAVAQAKLVSMVEGAALARERLAESVG